MTQGDTSTYNDKTNRINSFSSMSLSGAVRGAETNCYVYTACTIIIISIIIISTLPDYVIVVAQVKFLLMLPGVVHNSHTGDKIDYFLGGGVVQVVAALMAPVSVHPLQSQVAVGSSSVSHVRTSVCVSLSLSRRLSDTLSFTKKDLF